MQRMLIAYILTGLLFLLLPGTFLGVWNLISISSRHALDSLSPAWIQAHGHAQIFRLDRDFHPWYRVLFVDEDGPSAHLCDSAWLDLLRFVDYWKHDALA